MQGQLGELLSSILKVFRGHIYSEKSALCIFFFFHSKLSEKIHLNYVRVGRGAFK